MVGKEIGPYKILKKIGQGGMGIVYHGVHTRLEQEVAIKVLSPEYSAEPIMRERFIQEAKIQAQLAHPHVVNILNYLEDGEEIFLVMEYVKGETLDNRLATAGPLSQSEAVLVCQSVLSALDFMHARGVIHRDIKPANIMITDTGLVKVTDFGIAKITGEHGRTRTGMLIGTLWYMSPEQIQGESASVSSDLYALGITLYQMVTGQLPFHGDSEYTIMKAHLDDMPTPPWLIHAHISQALGRVILQAIEKTSARRYQNAAEFAEALTGRAQQPNMLPGDRPIAGQPPASRRRALRLSSWQYVTFASLSAMLAAILYVAVSDDIPFMASKPAKPIAVMPAPPVGNAFPPAPQPLVLHSPEQSSQPVPTAALATTLPPPQPLLRENVSEQKPVSSDKSEPTVTPMIASVPPALPPASSPTPPSFDSTAEVKEVYSWLVLATERALDVRSGLKQIPGINRAKEIAKERGNLSMEAKLQKNLEDLRNSIEMTFGRYTDSVKRIEEKKDFAEKAIEKYLIELKEKGDSESISIMNNVVKNHISQYSQSKKVVPEKWKSDIEKL